MAGVAAALALLFLEGCLRVVEAVSRRDWAVSPLPDHPTWQVLCSSGDELVLCPDRGPAYERVRPVRFAATPSRPRVVTIGESFVFGLGLDEADAWPARLGAALPEVEVLNFGRCGTYAGRLIAVLDAALAVHPDIVVLSVGNNEHTMTSYFTGPAARHPLLTYTLLRSLGGVRIYGVLHGLLAPPHVAEAFEVPPGPMEDDRDRLVRAARRRPPDLAAFGDLPLAGREVTAALEEEQRLKERIYADWMHEMVRRTRAAGAVPILTTLPGELTAPPTLSGVHDGDEARVRTLYAQLRQGGGDHDAIVAAGLAEDPKVAQFLYDRGMQLLHAQRRVDAATTLREAVEWEMIPDMTPSLNRIVREIAADEGCVLVDLDTLSDTALDNPGAVFLDRVHVNTSGAEAVARMLAPAVQAEISR